jgi:SecE/Sec61-gamma subunits of protein translocation complex
MACSSSTEARSVSVPPELDLLMVRSTNAALPLADRKEFVKICQAVGVGFLIMGAVGYVVKLSKLSLLLPIEEP